MPRLAARKTPMSRASYRAVSALSLLTKRNTRLGLCAEMSLAILCTLKHQWVIKGLGVDMFHLCVIAIQSNNDNKLCILDSAWQLLIQLITRVFINSGFKDYLYSCMLCEHL